MSTRLDLRALERRLGLPVTVAAEVLGTYPRQLQRLRARGLTIDEADALAVAAGMHPCEIWTEWWTDTDEAR